MEFFHHQEKLSDNSAIASILIVLLLLIAISPGLNLSTSMTIKSAGLSLSPPTNSYDYAVRSAQPQVDYRQCESKWAYDYTYTRKSSPGNDSPLASLLNSDRRNSLSRLTSSVPTFPNSLKMGLKTSYRFTDIPPPFFGI